MTGMPGTPEKKSRSACKLIVESGHCLAPLIDMIINNAMVPVLEKEILRFSPKHSSG